MHGRGGDPLAARRGRGRPGDRDPRRRGRVRTEVGARETLAACRGVSVVYGRGEAAVHALDRVDLSLGALESLALLGPSGSGKTTLLHVLGGLVTPAAGAVEWRGRPLASLDVAARGAARARGVAYVFQGA